MKNGYTPTKGIACRLPDLKNSPALREASGDDLRVLMHLALTDYAASVEEVATTLGISLTRAAAGIEYWTNAGILSQGGTAKCASLPVDDLILGTAKEDALEIKERRLKDCLDACAEVLGKLLNPSEINILVGLITNYEISESYLITLLDFCVSRLGVRGVKYTAKVAATLFEDGIRTDAALDAYIQRYETVHSNEGQIRRLFGLGTRSLTKKEDAMLARWFIDYGYDMEIVGAAYDITVNTAEKVTLSYTDKILAGWHAAGLRTLAEIDAYIAKQKEARTPAPAKKKKGGAAPLATSSFDVNNFFESALERSYGTTDKKN